MMYISEVITDFRTGNVTLIEGDAPPLTIEDYRRAIDAHVEATAQSRQYNSAAHMASYVASTVPEWAAEAEAFVAWRDQVWVTAIHFLATVTEAPTIEAVIEALPQIEWPTFPIKPSETFPVK